MRKRRPGNPGSSPGWAWVLFASLLSGCTGNSAFLLPNLQIRFEGSMDPAPGTVTLDEGAFSGSPSGGSVFVDVVIKDTQGVFGTSFVLAYVSDRFAFTGATEGTFLNENQAVKTEFLVATEPRSPGTESILVGLTREGVTTPDRNAAGEQVLMTLEFRPITDQEFSGPLVFEGNPQVVSNDGTVVVDETRFFGGTLRIDQTP